MRTVILILASMLAVSACEDILPIETVDLCEQPDPPSAECPQCDSPPFAADCPQCRGNVPEQGCANAPSPSGSGSGGAGADAPSSGAGGGSGSGGGRAGQGGRGGRGGDAGESGGPCAACPSGQPLCFEGNECVECIAHDDCAEATSGTRCEPQAHTCVECVGDDDCVGGTTPKCETGTHECVECLTGADCDASEPVCGSNHRCGPCASDEDCQDREGATHCETAAASGRAGECVECVGHGHCGNPEPQCTSGACVPCTGDAACESRDGAEVCNTRQDAETFGHCVECTGATEAQRCGATACKQSTGECTDVVRGTLLACRACEADSECDEATKCVPFEFDGAMLGTFCFFEDDGGSATHCAAMDSGRRPYNQVTALTSVDGADGTFCLPITTCQAVDDATGTNPKSCLNGAIPDATLCGDPDRDDGYCPGTGPSMGECSYVCQDHADCPAIGAVSCAGGIGQKFCQAM